MEQEKSSTELVKQSGKPSNSSALIIKVIKKWLAVFCTVAGRVPTKPLLDTWIELLGSVHDPRVLNSACELTAKTWKIANTIPPPGEILSRISTDFSHAKKVDALDQWMRAKRLIEAHYYPDLGYRGPILERTMRRAIDSAGGMHLIATCQQSELPWCQRRFIEYYEQSLQAGEVNSNYRIEDGDVKRLLTDLGNARQMR